MNNSFLTAAASYYGLNPDTTQVEWQNVNGEFVFAFQVKATADDLRGVLSRMKTIEDAEVQKQSEPPLQPAFATEDIRKHYDKLTPTERSQYGSFGCFKQAVLQGISPVPVDTSTELQEYIKNRSSKPMPDDDIGLLTGSGYKGAVTSNADNSPSRQVVHVDVPDDSEPVDMRVAWLRGGVCSEEQKQFAVDYDPERHRYLIQWAMLTDEQKAQAKDNSGGLTG